MTLTNELGKAVAGIGGIGMAIGATLFSIEGFQALYVMHGKVGIALWLFAVGTGLFVTGVAISDPKQ